MQASPFPVSVLREPSPDAVCTCEHWIHCNCACHTASCDSAEATCDVAYLADDGGLSRWGCRIARRASRRPDWLGCELIGWHVPVRRPIGSA